MKMRPPLHQMKQCLATYQLVSEPNRSKSFEVSEEDDSGKRGFASTAGSKTEVYSVNPNVPSNGPTG